MINSQNTEALDELYLNEEIDGFILEVPANFTVTIDPLFAKIKTIIALSSRQFGLLQDMLI